MMKTMSQHSSYFCQSVVIYLTIESRSMNSV